MLLSPTTMPDGAVTTTPDDVATTTPEEDLGNMLAIEIHTEDWTLKKHLFPRPKSMVLFTEEHKGAILNTLNISSPEAKLLDFVEHSSNTCERIQWLARLPPSVFGACQYLTGNGRMLALTLAIVFNTILLATYQYKDQALNDREYIGQGIGRIVILGWSALLLAVYVAVLLAHVVMNKSLKSFHWFNVLFAALNLTVSHVFGALLLMNFVALSVRLQNITKAILAPLPDIFSVLFLFIFIILIFSVAIFESFAGDFEPSTGECVTLWGCFKITFSYGVRQYGGIGEVMRRTNGDRILLDVTFFCVKNMCLALVLGIFSNTFAALREDSMCRMQYMMNTTLISGFEKAEVGDEVFDQISNVDQPCWNYTMFMFHIWVTLSYTATASAHHVMSHLYKLDITPEHGGVNWQRCTSGKSLYRGFTRRSSIRAKSVSELVLSSSHRACVSDM